MGWLIGWRSKAEVVDHLTNSVGAHVELIDKSLAGNEFYMLLRNKETGKRFIVLALLRGERVNRFDRGANWGYKDMDEAMGPCYYNCPERLLAQSDCESEYAVKWRAACRAARAAKSARAKFLATLKPGDHFMFGESESVYIGRQRYRNRMLHIGRDLKDGRTYRYAQSRISPMPAANA